MKHPGNRSRRTILLTLSLLALIGGLHAGASLTGAHRPSGGG